MTQVFAPYTLIGFPPELRRPRVCACAPVRVRACVCRRRAMEGCDSGEGASVKSGCSSEAVISSVTLVIQQWATCTAVSTMADGAV